MVPPFPGRLEQVVVIPGEDDWILESFLLERVYQVARIADRKDPFARRIFLTSLCDNRTRMHLQEFRVSRAYIFLNAYQSRT